ncbi:calcium/sodium antiporter [Dokdonella sp.]|uniref:calcium/sodium antiporter n=1 Tax=Dokdonella sp. TaxID=2291710 RepID=UPI0035287208
MELTNLVFLVAGLAVLVIGADLLVRGASRLALRFGISPLVIGLTVVAFGTSSPELAVSVQSGLAGQADIAVGNVVGSNIFNVLAVLGMAALIAPLMVQQQLVRFEVPLLVGLSVLVLVMAQDGRIGTFDGLLLVAGLVAYTVYVIRQTRREVTAVQAEYAKEFSAAPAGWLERLPVQVVLVLGGLGLLVLGATWLVDSAVSIARALEISEVVIGLTIVAAGTGFPELATSVVAAMRGERDIAVGNIVGSSIFNLLGILGVAALVTPDGLSVAPGLVVFDMPVMIAVAFACLPIFGSGHRVARWEGAVFLAYYVIYVTYLILAATQHDALRGFGATMLGFVLPLTGITLLVLWTHQRSRENAP